MARVKRRPPTLIEGLEWVFCLLALAMMSEALFGPVFAPDQTLDGPEWLRLIWLPVYAGFAGMAVLRAPRLASVWLPGLAVGALVLLAFASERWSIAPDITGRRSLALLFTTLFGLLLAARYGWKALIELVAATSLLLAVGSCVAALAFPSFGVHADLHPGAWKGLWYEKNMLGAVMARGALACLCAAVIAPERRRLWATAAVLCGALVLMSTSKTSLIGLLLAVGGVAAVAVVRRGGAVAVAAVWCLALGAGVGAIVMLTAPELVLQALGKDPTLTGRTDIWAALLRQVQERPWTGYGYAAFWEPDLGPAWYVRRDVQWEAPTAHNGWLEVLIQLGWPGLVLVAAHLSVAALAALARLPRGEEAYWAVLSLALFVLFSLSESTILQQNNTSWVLYVATTAKLFQLRTRRAPAPTPEREAVQVAQALAFVDAGWRRPPVAAPAAAAESLRRTSAAP
jgi:O-antigen ligase